MVAEQRQRAGLGAAALGDPSPTLARSPLVIAIWNDRRDVLATRCDGGVIDWKCIGDVAGTPWGTHRRARPPGASVKPGQPAPDTTAAGLLSLGEATASYFGSSGFASNDFADAGFRAWFTRLEQADPLVPRVAPHPARRHALHRSGVVRPGRHPPRRPPVRPSPRPATADD